MKLFTNLKFNLILATFFILLGLLGLWYVQNHQLTAIVAPPISYTQPLNPKSVNPTIDNSVKQNNSAKLSSTTSSGQPVKLLIPSLNIDLAVTPGYYNPRTGQWTLTLNNVQYAEMTPLPNAVGGNTFLYGHARRGVFATLHAIKQGSKAIVKTQDGKAYTYSLARVEVVSPENSAGVFGYKGAPILTIQTCTGMFYQDRQLFTFTLERVT